MRMKTTITIAITLLQPHNVQPWVSYKDNGLKMDPYHILAHAVRNHKQARELNNVNLKRLLFREKSSSVLRHNTVDIMGISTRTIFSASNSCLTLFNSSVREFTWEFNSCLRLSNSFCFCNERQLQLQSTDRNWIYTVHYILSILYYLLTCLVPDSYSTYAIKNWLMLGRGIRPQICINILQMPYLLFTPYHIM